MDKQEVVNRIIKSLKDAVEESRRYTFENAKKLLAHYYDNVSINEVIASAHESFATRFNKELDELTSESHPVNNAIKIMENGGDYLKYCEMRGKVVGEAWASSAIDMSIQDTL